MQAAEQALEQETGGGAAATSAMPSAGEDPISQPRTEHPAKCSLLKTFCWEAWHPSLRPITLNKQNYHPDAALIDEHHYAYFSSLHTQHGMNICSICMSFMPTKSQAAAARCILLMRTICAIARRHAGKLALCNAMLRCTWPVASTRTAFGASLCILCASCQKLLGTASGDAHVTTSQPGFMLTLCSCRGASKHARHSA